MQFCPNCGMRLKFKVVKNETISTPSLTCEKCGFVEATNQSAEKRETSDELNTQIKVVGAKEASIKTMPTTTAECPKCHHREAYWWFLQTRAMDEPPTQFYRCVKCSHTWRQYS